MRILFVHQNFPGQFKHLAPTLAKNPKHRVYAFSMQKNAPANWQNVRIISCQADKGTSPTVHRWVSDLETKVIRGEATFKSALRMKAEGLRPDIIVAHPGWGESLFLKEVWPDSRLGIYCEFFYRADGADVGFDPEFPAQESGDGCRLKLKNVNNWLHFEIADAGISPTEWQASTFPPAFRDRISVIHDGIDTDSLIPNPEVTLTLNENLKLTRADEIITFVNRNLEPYRGYHIFMRALPEILRRRPRARVLIVGGNDVSYGARPPEGTTWKDQFLAEVEGELDMSRVHFLGNVPYQHFIPLLQLSTVHVYLTYPFVLSWSLLEAMSVGCAIVASNTAPLREAIHAEETGRLVDFFDTKGLAESVCTLLDDPAARARLGSNARQFARQHYDLKQVCLPRQLAWVESLKHL